MHSRLLVICNKECAESSREAREYVFDVLSNDNSFVGDGGRFGSPLADWFVIGGRWSGELSRLTWAKAVHEKIAALEKAAGVTCWGAFYGTSEKAETQKRLIAEVEALYQKSIPAEFREQGLVYNRDTDGDYGYADDAMIVTPELYELLKPYEGLDQSEGEYVDLNWELVSPDFIHAKWLVVADYHY